ncbi:GNAT family N-acetyltransferase [Alloprevotella tannerae]|uniref:GNAT family N-acetyltransferase n=1 Tax=Alloprevotella tannerae TaxID=76122 RepID=A0A929RWS6_9BACT|nr:GNAT family N-acetyltransferase [Alloprevotella tannerae]MBF0970725.1 GNAT family N-acetyltransferase [Alloprevotella tannerae]
MEETIIAPVERDLLAAELTPERKLRTTNKGGNEIYVVTYHQAPNVLREIGRLREIAFRTAGGGTGKSCDLDESDVCEHPYYQLIVWNPASSEILGGYRFLPGAEAAFDQSGQPILATSHLFHFSDEFLRDYFPRTVELGRSFVTLEYQSSRAMTKGLFALDNLWDGLGALTVVIPGLKYFFGKMTMYPSFDRQARDMILFFLQKHFGDCDNLVTPFQPVRLVSEQADLDQLFCEDDLKRDYLILNRAVRRLGYNIPPLVNAYMGLSPTMRCFGTAVNDTFGNVEETGILIAEDEILEEKRKRHIDSFIKEHPDWINNFSNLVLRKSTTR